MKTMFANLYVRIGLFLFCVVLLTGSCGGGGGGNGVLPAAEASQTPQTAATTPDALPMGVVAARVSALSLLPPVASGHMMFGDSIVNMMEWTELIGFPVHNRGVAGATTGNLLAGFDSIFKGTPSTFFYGAGINDILSGIDRSISIQNVRVTIERVRVQSPNTVVKIMSVLPVSYWNGEDYNPSVVAFNSNLANLAASMGVEYIDAHGAIVANGVLPFEMTMDGIHLSAKGYQVWASFLRSYLQ